MATRYEAFDIQEILINNEKGLLSMKGVTSDGKVREFGLQVLRDLVTNKLSLEPYRHFTDSESVSAFRDSEPWEEHERRGDTE